MNRSASAAARPPNSKHKALAVRALWGVESITEPGDEAEVSRKFMHAQTHRASAALDAAFATPANEDRPVLFELRITQVAVERRIPGLALAVSRVLPRCDRVGVGQFRLFSETTGEHERPAVFGGLAI